MGVLFEILGVIGKSIINKAFEGSKIEQGIQNFNANATNYIDKEQLKNQNVNSQNNRNKK